MSFNFKTASPDVSLPITGYVLGGDSQSAALPSTYPATQLSKVMGTIVPTDGGRDAFQAALTLARDQSANANGLIKVLYPYPGVNLWDRGVSEQGSDGTRVPGVCIEIMPGCRIKKNIAAWATDNALIQLAFYNEAFSIGQGVLDGGQTVTAGPGGIVGLNGTASDLVRIFSCARIVFRDLRFVNAADSWLRVIPRSDDTQPALMHHLLVENCHVEDCNQFSQTNSSAETPGVREMHFMHNTFRRGNSIKFAGRAEGSEAIWHINNEYFDYFTALEIDGPSKIISQGNRYNDCSVRAMQIISNNSFTTLDYRSSHVVIDDFASRCAEGVVFKPDAQADALLFDWDNADIKLTTDGMTAVGGYAIDMEGAFFNLRAHHVSADWKGGTPIRAMFRGNGRRTNAHLINEGYSDFTSNGSKRIFFIGSTATRQGQYAVDGLILEGRGLKTVNCERFAHFAGAALSAGTASGATTNAAGYAIGATTLTLASAGAGTILAGDAIKFAGDPNPYIVTTGDADVSNGGTIVIASPGLRTTLSAATKAITILSKRFMRNLELRGDVVGGFTGGLLFNDGVEKSDGFFANGFRYKGDASGGLYVQHFFGGAIDACHVDAPQDVIKVENNCAGIRIGENSAFLSGVPTPVVDAQGPFMASAARTTTQVDVTITHGLGTDFTVPTNARRMFEYIDAAGARVGITSVARQSATVLRIVIASDTAGTVICHPKRIFNALNGAAFGDPSDLPYDNSGAAAPIRAGTVAAA